MAANIDNHKFCSCYSFTNKNVQSIHSNLLTIRAFFGYFSHTPVFDIWSGITPFSHPSLVFECEKNRHLATADLHICHWTCTPSIISGKSQILLSVFVFPCQVKSGRASSVLLFLFSDSSWCGSKRSLFDSSYVPRPFVTYVLSSSLSFEY